MKALLAYLSFAACIGYCLLRLGYHFYLHERFLFWDYFEELGFDPLFWLLLVAAWFFTSAITEKK